MGVAKKLKKSQKAENLLLFAFLLTFISLCAPVAAYSAVQMDGGLITVEAEGFAPIVDGNINAAREQARRSTYQNALEQALGAYVTGITEMNNYEVVKDKVFSQTTGIVKKFDVVSEKEGEDGILTITAICQVGQAALDGVLGPAVLDALGNPRVMVLLDERIESNTPFIFTSEGEVLRVFEKAGFLLVDQTQADILKNIDLNVARVRDNPEEFRQMARDFQADVLIYGKAYGSSFANQSVSGVRIYGVKSTVQLKAVLANNAYQLGSDVFDENTKGTSVEAAAIEGLKLAASKAGKSVVHKIAYALVSGSAGGIPGRTVKIKISNLSFNDARSLREKLQGLSGVTGVYQRLFRDRAVELDVVSDKTADDMAGILSDLGYEIDDLSSAVVEGSLK